MLVKRLFLSVQLPKVQIAGRLKHFVKKWQLLTKGQSILEIVKGYQIHFLSFSTPTAAATKGNSSHSKRKICRCGGDSKSLEKGCNRKSLYQKAFCKNSVREQSISSKEKG